MTCYPGPDERLTHSDRILFRRVARVHDKGRVIEAQIREEVVQVELRDTLYRDISKAALSSIAGVRETLRRGYPCSLNQATS